MSRLLRYYLENYCYFVSVKTYASKKIFQDKQAAGILVKVVFEVKAKLNFLLPAFVVMPEHLHLLIVPDKRNTISDVMRHIKGRFSRRFSQGINSPDYEGEGNWGSGRSEKISLYMNGNLPVSHKDSNSHYLSRNKNLPRSRRAGNLSQPRSKVWQNGFYDHVIRNEKDFLSRLEYVCNNPVKAGLIERSEDYQFLFIDKNLEKYL